MNLSQFHFGTSWMPHELHLFFFCPMPALNKIQIPRPLFSGWGNYPRFSRDLWNWLCFLKECERQRARGWKSLGSRLHRWREIKDEVSGGRKDGGGRSSSSSAVLIRACLPVISCPSGFVLEQDL